MDSKTKTYLDITTEEKVIEEVKVNPQAFKVLYQQYYKRIFLFILHRIGDKEQTADVTSQVFTKALVNISRYTHKGLPFSSWLFRIAINEINQFYRRTKRERLVLLEETHTEMLYEEMFGDSVEDELKRKLPQILERLKPEELQLIELRYLEGRAFKEVSQIINTSEVYAKVKTYRTLEKMKKLFVRLL